MTATFKIKHLASQRIDNIALSLDEDVYGANGDLSDWQIRDRLIANIHGETGHQYFETGSFPVWTVASLIWGVWTYCDRKNTELMVEQANSDALAKLPRPRPMTFAFAGN